MDTKLKNYSHSLATKIIVFLIVIISFAGAITVFLNLGVNIDGDFELVFEDSYFQSRRFINDSAQVTGNLVRLMDYKNEENILNGGTITEEELSRKKEELFSIFREESKNYNPNLTYEENYHVFEEIYAEKIQEMRNELIQEDLNNYKYTLQRLEEIKGVLYYASDGVNEISNTSQKTKEYFQSFPVYFLLEKTRQGIFPEEIKASRYFHWLRYDINSLEPEESMYIAFTDEFLNPRMEKWQRDKDMLINAFYQLAGFILTFLVSFVYLLVIVGRKSFKDEIVHLNFVDKIYTDFNLAMCFALICLWIAIMVEVIFIEDIYEIVFPLTFFIGTLGLILVLSLVKHFKNKTFIKHSLIYKVLYKIISFIRDVYNSGSVGVKAVLLAVGYPLLVAATIFIFPITIGLGVWFAWKKAKEFNIIKEGVEKVKGGDIHHTINLPGEGEFAQLAANINSITDGLSKAVENELKSERLKTELITNVSHDLRTPLTSIITYIDLLKNEQDPQKSAEYLEILEQKAQRLKILTDDLFDAAKASSGNIPLNLDKIDLVSLIKQGLGELDDKVQESQLQFKINNQHEKMYVTADGKLLWRAIENLLSNIFKYALKGSRVYIDIIDLGTEIMLTLKNISAYELNISPEDLMERFVRGDKSRSTQGSGLGLSIAKSLVELQKGKFMIQIDGDLFKVIIKLSK